MNDSDIENLPEYNYELDRYKIRYCGVGPIIDKNPRKIWPRDTLDYKEEIRKILYPELVKLINNEEHCSNIRNILKIVFESLKKCQMKKLFNAFSKLDPCCFDKIPYAIEHALDAYTDTKKIVLIIHKIITSINKISKQKNFVTKTLFGCEKNYNIFKKHMEWLVKGNGKFQKMLIGHFVLFADIKVDISKVSWLDGMPEGVKYRVFMQFVYSITRFILEFIRRYYYITWGPPFGDKLFYYRYDLWEKMQTRTMNNFVEKEFLYKMKYEYNMNIKENDISRIRFHLKRDNLRLICYNQKQRTQFRIITLKIKAVIRHVLFNSPNYEKFTLVKLLKSLNYFKTQKIENDCQVYFVRADIKDCFPSIDQEKVRTIIKESLNADPLIKDETINIHTLECKTKPTKLFNRNIKKGYMMNKYTLDPDKIHKVDRYEEVIEKFPIFSMSLTEFDEVYLRPHLINCILRESSQSKIIYNLVKGLRQGSPYSPLFCSIYIQAAFNQHLKDYYGHDDCKIFNYVDDILFISTDLKKSQGFMIKMLEGFKDYNLKMNLSKLQCNFRCPKIDDKYCLQEKDFIFFKQRISVDTFECRYDYNFKNLELQDTFRVTPYNDQEFIKKSIINSRISPVCLDFKLNGHVRVVKNIFEFALMLAFKVATTILISFKLKDHNKNQSEKYIAEIIELISRRLFIDKKVFIHRKLIENDLEKIEIKTIVTEACKFVWNTNKMRHRVVERKELQKLFNRFKLKSYVGNNLLGIIDNIRQEFDKSPFHRLRLPGNNKIMTKFHRIGS